MRYIIYDVQDYLQTDLYDYFIHGCNDRGAMRSGIAKIVRDLFPKAYTDYKAVVDHYGRGADVLQGLCIPTDVGQGRNIINAITQVGYGYDGGPYASYDSIDTVFRKMSDLADVHDPIAFPLIGAGRGGLRWEAIKEIIEHRLEYHNYACIVRPEDISKYNLPYIPT